MAKLTLSKPLIFALALVLLVVAVLTLPVADWLQGFFTWIEANPNYCVGGIRTVLHCCRGADAAG